MEEKSANTNLIVKTTSLAMHIVSEYIRPGDTVVDGTMGNGYDTLSLAVAAGCTGEGKTPHGRVYAFDIHQGLPQGERRRRAGSAWNPPDSGFS